MNRTSKVIIMVSHGMPPTDYPQKDKQEFFRLMSRFHDDSPANKKSKEYERFLYLENKMRAWPRNIKNDPFSEASKKVARYLGEKMGCSVICAFNEFASPSIEEAFNEASQLSPDEVKVITPMMIRGGSHSDKDIPRAIQQARKKYPYIKVSYVWPFLEDDIAEFLANKIKASENKSVNTNEPSVALK